MKCRVSFELNFETSFCRDYSPVVELTVKSAVYKSEFDSLLKRNKERIQRSEKTITPDSVDSNQTTVDLGYYKLDSNIFGAISGKVTSLYLDNCGLQEIPSVLCELGSISVLVLKNNQLTSLPTRLFQMHNLTFLDLSFNNLLSIPDEISQLINLQSLILAFNNISHLSESVKKKLDSIKFQIDLIHILILLDWKIGWIDTTFASRKQTDKASLPSSLSKSPRAGT